MSKTQVKQRIVTLREFIRQQGDDEGVAYINAHLEDDTLSTKELLDLERMAKGHVKPTYDELCEAQRLYIQKRFGKHVFERSEYEVGSDLDLSGRSDKSTYVESVIRLRVDGKTPKCCNTCKRLARRWFGYDLMCVTYSTDQHGKTSNINYTGRPNSFKHVVYRVG